MYRVLLVDDEEDVREGLVVEVDWEALDLRIVGLAENGREALEMAERVEPDIVVTDISMPFMDGLELARRLRERNPLVKVVILTGYDEFDYARQAVSLSVDEYLLKPFSAGHLTELLTRLRAQMAAEVAEREDVQQLRDHYYTSLPLLQADLMATLLHRQKSPEYIHGKAKQCGLDLHGERYGVSVLTLHMDGDQSADAELKQFAALNIAAEVWTEHGAGHAFMHQETIVLLYVDRWGGEDGEKRQQQALENVMRSINHYLRIPATVGSGSIVNTLAGVKHAYEDALLALDYRLVPGTDPLIYIADVERQTAGKLRFDELKQQTLTRCLKAGTQAELEDALEIIFREITVEHGRSDIQLYLIEVLTNVWKAAQASGEAMEDIFGAGFQLYADLFRLPGLSEAQGKVSEVCLLVQHRIASGRQHVYKDIVEQALSFTKEHYADPDLSIQKVCGHLHISSGYFCGIFKKEVQLTFLQYLMQIRMEAAKELLRSTEMKSFEIAGQVGFAEPNYFSFCFKKHIGVSPKEYRKQTALTASEGTSR
ncbi:MULTISPECIES: response regulator [unclassified Paenibacillus]|uniref:response regulator n=1 Tax=unclassified Paenibacillus TaxID=185978 RepID=UPI0009A7DC27|nr:MULTISPECIES: response regulator [unclassified Paenibacillus]SLK02092.1 two-component system, response regulator YesN [Paenibacillus sp. RU5A]SOC68893.1 two-component system, response regulator YesN [Paenibacillus sp. RU26A]SOC71340.1 two-component system, response regulator YesN [Paenibacillus sp. RU5M]